MLKFSVYYLGKLITNYFLCISSLLTKSSLTHYLFLSLCLPLCLTWSLIHFIALSFPILFLMPISMTSSFYLCNYSLICHPSSNEWCSLTTDLSQCIQSPPTNNTAPKVLCKLRYVISFLYTLDWDWRPFQE